MLILSAVCTALSFFIIIVLYVWGFFLLVDDAFNKHRFSVLILALVLFVSSITNCAFSYTSQSRVKNFVSVAEENNSVKINYIEMATNISLNDMEKEMVKQASQKDMEKCCIFFKPGSKNVYVGIYFDDDTYSEFDFSKETFYGMMPYFEICETSPAK